MKLLALGGLHRWFDLPLISSNTFPLVRNYRPLGKTGLRMSDISMGTGEPPPVSLVLRAIDRGINYIDTAPDYGRAEEVVGEALRKRKDRQIIVATKFCLPGPYPNHLPKDAKKKDYIRALEGSLRRLKRDWVDIVFVHAIGEQSRNIEEERQRLLSEEMLSAVETLKRQGKVRLLGVSSHGPYNMEDLMMEAVRSGHYDMIMVAFNFMKFPELPEVIKEAHKRGMAVVAMKTLAGAKQVKIPRSDEPFALAALRWVLKHSELSGLVITIRSVSQLNLYLRASGTGFGPSDEAVLRKYEKVLS
ncbi:MAG: aldo/keto reductase, partial [Nitrospirae bacterium]